MKITERRLRSVIRSVIREAYGDYEDPSSSYDDSKYLTGMQRRMARANEPLSKEQACKIILDNFKLFSRCFQNSYDEKVTDRMSPYYGYTVYYGENDEDTTWRNYCVESFVDKIIYKGKQANHTNDEVNRWDDLYDQIGEIMDDADAFTFNIDTLHYVAPHPNVKHYFKTTEELKKIEEYCKACIS